jgi:hypothetical protein
MAIGPRDQEFVEPALSLDHPRVERNRPRASGGHPVVRLGHHHLRRCREFAGEHVALREFVGQSALQAAEVLLRLIQPRPPRVAHRQQVEIFRTEFGAPLLRLA